MIEAKEINNYLKAGFSIFWIETHETTRIKKEVIPLIETFSKYNDEVNFKVRLWNCQIKENTSPMEPLQELLECEKSTIMFLENFHWFIERPPIIQAIQNNIPFYQNQDKAIVIISNEVKIPKELEKDIILMKLPLPGEKEIEEIHNYISGDNTKSPNEQIIQCSKGLTRKELEDIYALSLVEQKTICCEVITKYKKQAIEKNGFITVLESNKTFKDVIGYKVYKEYKRKTINNPISKGTITIGPPGTGKTSIAEAIIGEFGLFGISLNMNKLFSKYVGETGKNISIFIDIVKSIGSCYVLIDEFEKAFAGSGSGGEDSGNTKRSLSQFLDFLQNRPNGIVIDATANGVIGIPPEYLRPGRWDCSPFFIDLPNETTREKILEHYFKKYGLKLGKSSLKNLDLKDFSGAEIEALCHNASMLNIPIEEARKYILPIAKTMKEDIDRIRKWAIDKTISAEENEINNKRRIAK